MHLDLAVLLDVANSGLGKSLANLEDLLADLLRLIVAVVVAVLCVAVGLGLADLDLARTLSKTEEDVATGGLLALAIANPIAAALIALILVVSSLWLVVVARRFLRRVIDRVNLPPRSPA